MVNDSSTKSERVAVIGAGIIGVNCALELQSLGFQVTLIDKKGIGEGCSKKNAGHFATEQIFPMAEANLLWQLPKLLLDPLGPMALSPKHLPKALPWFLRFTVNMQARLRRKNTRAIKALNQHALDYYAPLLRAANAENLITKKGSLLVFENSNVDSAKRCYLQYKNAGINVKLLSRFEALKVEPSLHDNVNYAIYFPDVAHTANPLKICQVLGQQAFVLGAKILTVEVANITSNNSKVTIQFHNNKNASKTTFDHLVVAAGAWSKPLLKQLGYKLPIEAERGYSLDISSQSNTKLSIPVASAERKFIMTPMAHGLRLSGTVEFAGLEQTANIKRAEVLYKNARMLLQDMPDISHQEVAENSWLGFRPSLPDSLPVICQAPKHSSIYFALGHQHLGLTQGAITGKLIGQLLTKQKTDIDITPYCISRFN